MLITALSYIRQQQLKYDNMETEVQHAGKFDDLVLTSKEETLFIQVKHEQVGKQNKWFLVDHFRKNNRLFDMIKAYNEMPKAMKEKKHKCIFLSNACINEEVFENEIGVKLTKLEENEKPNFSTLVKDRNYIPESNQERKANFNSYFTLQITGKPIKKNALMQKQLKKIEQEITKEDRRCFEKNFIIACYQLNVDELEKLVCQELRKQLPKKHETGCSLHHALVRYITDCCTNSEERKIEKCGINQLEKFLEQLKCYEEEEDSCLIK